ncbi:MAG: protein phosphatase 2C domain-containing protein [Bdellovibrionaceae bacterium]|nr:protein phosphatase 2C domain-containing protein [Pseudobdellovibrionaceae bacterium]
MNEFNNLMSQQEYFLSDKILIGGYELILFTAKNPNKIAEPNEDTIGLFQINNECLVLTIADGAGGHPAGNKASLIATETLHSVFLKSKNTQKNIRDLILDGMELSNKNIIESNLGCRTTFTIASIENNSVRIYQVGDSGALLVGQRGSLKFKTLFQSPVGYGLEAGLIQENEALSHPDLNQVSNLMGEGEMHINIGPEMNMSPKDTLLLASDGIFDNFSIDQLIDLIRIGKLELVADNLLSYFKKDIEKKLKKYDDYSFIICRIASDKL